MRKLFSLIFFLPIVLFGFQTKPKIVFGSQKVLRKIKNVKNNYFLMFRFLMKIIKENQIYIKLFRNLSILKLFNLYNETKINKISLKY